MSGGSEARCGVRASTTPDTCARPVLRLLRSVIAWEPVKEFRAFLEYSIARNKLQHKVEVRAAAVTAPAAAAAATSGDQAVRPARRAGARRLHGRRQPRQRLQPEPAAARNVTLVVPLKGGSWSTASVDGANIFLNVAKDLQLRRVHAPAETLDEVVLPMLQTQQQRNGTESPAAAGAAAAASAAAAAAGRPRRVALLKVDVEGHEPQALAGAAALLRAGGVDNLLLEYSPMVAEKNE